MIKNNVHQPKEEEEGVLFSRTVDFDNPTNIVSVRLVSSCPNARAGVTSRIVRKKTLRATFDPITNYH